MIDTIVRLLSLKLVIPALLILHRWCVSSDARRREMARPPCVVERVRRSGLARRGIGSVLKVVIPVLRQRRNRAFRGCRRTGFGPVSELRCTVVRVVVVVVVHLVLEDDDARGGRARGLGRTLSIVLDVPIFREMRAGGGGGGHSWQWLVWWHGCWFWFVFWWVGGGIRVGVGVVLLEFKVVVPALGWNEIGYWVRLTRATGRKKKRGPTCCVVLVVRTHVMGGSCRRGLRARASVVVAVVVKHVS